MSKTVEDMMHKAIYLTIEDIEADSGNHEPLEEYLLKVFSIEDLVYMERICYRLADTILKITKKDNFKEKYGGLYHPLYKETL